jgi:hypothetical protein
MNLHLQITILMRGRIDGKKINQKSELINFGLGEG